MKRIPLLHNRFALIDNFDFEWLSQWNWFFHKAGSKAYVARTIKCKGVRKKIYMHRLLLNAPGDLQVDHINGNGLDNRRFNLRLCTNAQNQHNCKAKGGSSRYKGVCFIRTSDKWLASIRFNYKSRHIGYFVSEIEAAKAYDEKAKELFGEFAQTNAAFFLKEG